MWAYILLYKKRNRLASECKYNCGISAIAHSLYCLKLRIFYSAAHYIYQSIGKHSSSEGHFAEKTGSKNKTACHFESSSKGTLRSENIIIIRHQIDSDDGLFYFTASPGLTILFTHSCRISQIFPHTLKIVHLSMRNARFQLSRIRASSSDTFLYTVLEKLKSIGNSDVFQMLFIRLLILFIIRKINAVQHVVPFLHHQNT